VADRKQGSKGNTGPDDSPTGPTVRDPGDGETPALRPSAFRGTLDKGLGRHIYVEPGRDPNPPSYDIFKHQE
jgi:hypothetical protein